MSEDFLNKEPIDAKRAYENTQDISDAVIDKFLGYVYERIEEKSYKGDRMMSYPKELLYPVLSDLKYEACLSRLKSLGYDVWENPEDTKILLISW